MNANYGVPLSFASPVIGKSTSRDLGPLSNNGVVGTNPLNGGRSDVLLSFHCYLSSTTWKPASSSWCSGDAAKSAVCSDETLSPPRAWKQLSIFVGEGPVSIGANRGSDKRGFRGGDAKA